MFDWRHHLWIEKTLRRIYYEINCAKIEMLFEKVKKFWKYEKQKSIKRDLVIVLEVKTVMCAVLIMYTSDKGGERNKYSFSFFLRMYTLYGRLNNQPDLARLPSGRTKCLFRNSNDPSRLHRVAFRAVPYNKHEHDTPRTSKMGFALDHTIRVYFQFNYLQFGDLLLLKTDFVPERRRCVETKNVCFSESSALNVQHVKNRFHYLRGSRFRRTTAATNKTYNHKTAIAHASTVGVPVQYWLSVPARPPPPPPLSPPHQTRRCRRRRRRRSVQYKTYRVCWQENRSV